MRHLERRIEELTAELEQERRKYLDMVEHNARNVLAAESEVARLRDRLEAALATERAAREQAEATVSRLRARENSVADQIEASQAAYVRSLQGERNTALARVKELENETYIQKNELKHVDRLYRARVSELEAAESALADAQHRIAELEAYGNDCCARAISGAVGNHLHRIAQLESALASARELMVRWLAWWKGKEARAAIVRDSRAWLSSNPAPVAAQKEWVYR